MNVEQIAREFVTKMNDAEKNIGLLTSDAMVDGGVLPTAVPAAEAIKMMSGLRAGMPDLQFTVQKVTVNGNKATVNAVWGGTHTGTLTMPGMPGIPATGKKISAKDTYIVTVQGDKVSHMTVASPADGGIPAALAQAGAQLPAM